MWANCNPFGILEVEIIKITSIDRIDIATCKVIGSKFKDFIFEQVLDAVYENKSDAVRKRRSVLNSKINDLRKELNELPL